MSQSVPECDLSRSLAEKTMQYHRRRLTLRFAIIFIYGVRRLIFSHFRHSADFIHQKDWLTTASTLQLYIFSCGVCAFFIHSFVQTHTANWERKKRIEKNMQHNVMPKFCLKSIWNDWMNWNWNSGSSTSFWVFESWPSTKSSSSSSSISSIGWRWKWNKGW